MSEPGSSENPNRPAASKKVWGINDTPDEIEAQVGRHIHKSETRQGGGFLGLGKIFGEHITSTKYDAKGITEENRPPEIFRHKGHEPPPLPEGKFITDRKGRTRRVGD